MSRPGGARRRRTWRVLAVAVAAGGLILPAAQAIAAFTATTQTEAATYSIANSATYSATVLSTSGLINYWRLGEASVSADTFSTGAGGLVTSRSGETGATWTAETVNTDTATITAAGRVRKSGAGTIGSVYYASGVPAIANYTVEADVYVASNVTDDAIGVVGRADLSTPNETFYLARYEQANTRWILYRVNNNVWTWLGESGSQPLTALTTHRLTLDMNGSNIRLLVDGVGTVSVNDATPLTLVGRGGLALGFSYAGATTITNSTGMHLDNFRIDAQAADSAGTSHGRYLGGPALSQTGAITADANTAARFDGVDDFVRTPAQTLNSFSVEFWFKSTQGIGTSTSWFNGAALVDSTTIANANDWGTSLRSDGRVVAGIGSPNTSITSATGGYDDGAWHHVVFTRSGATGATVLYIDGSSSDGGTENGPTGARHTYAIAFGRQAEDLSQAYQGHLDEVSLYNVVLNQTTVTAHRAAGL